MRYTSLGSDVAGALLFVESANAWWMFVESV